MDPVTKRRWLPRGEFPEAEAVTALTGDLPVSRLVARLLLVRGLTGSAAGEFLSGRLVDLPDPLLLPDMECAARRVAAAVERGEPFAVHGDYDVDGITGTTLLVEGLRACGAQVDYHIPLRLKDGYGLSGSALESAAAAGIRLVISVDCGVSAHDEALLARELEIDLVITDHHQPPPHLPQAFAIVNPQRSESSFPFRDLAGVGVAFFLLAAVRRMLRESGWFATRPEPDIREVLDLVALGTIADLVPLQGVNRTLTRIGLSLLDRGDRPGVHALKEIAGVKSVNCGVVGFQLAPRLNAAGRLEDAARGVDLLLEPDRNKALETARLLDRFNRERQQIELQTLAAALDMVAALPADRNCSIVLARDGWHSGVIGIVASRLVEKFYRPTVLIALDGEGGKGSARSIRGVHLYRALQECAPSLLAFGGHEMAAGLSLARDQVDMFTQSFEAVAKSVLTDEDLIPVLLYDGVALLDELDFDQVTALERLSPFGMGNPEPVLLIEKIRARQLQRVGEGHLRFIACQGGESHPAIAFGMAARQADFQGEVDLLVSPQINRYNGREMVQLRVRDVRGSTGS
ncbi:MAG: single-stranded-DNA-specific exonuclease RecJ [Desulfuromonadales bacterium]|nr:single-stranded-DNA-specific exonuclease RecJ [Desulfuromonadales bacterium]